MMKKRIAMLLFLLLLCTLSACGSESGADADLVFINDSDTIMSAVVVNFRDSGAGAQNADGSPLKRGESFGFEVGEYPVTVLVYDSAVGRIEKGELAQIVIDKAPPEGKRWYVTARDGVDGLILGTDTCWPEGV